ncbi:MAG: TIGR01212 family radical SAM protein [Deltaproteobacteria bacterium]|nr:TIGR01212 family radical SAM protein [Deltaproteobacteria bacterium]
MTVQLSPKTPYYSLNAYLKDRVGERVQKITLDAGLTCPNRDGRVGWGGCIYCNPRGSGTGAHAQGHSITRQLADGMAHVGKRYGARKFMAYFQSFSNTYAPLEKLCRLYEEALAHPQVVGLSIGTRPDCLSPELIKLLSSYSRTHLVWLELGLQSAQDRTLALINRGHDAPCFARAAHLTAGQGLHVLAHVILGLPQEGKAEMLATARFLSSLPLDGVKIHLLYVIRQTPLARMFAQGAYTPLRREAYIELLVDFIELLPPQMVIHRLTGDPHPHELVEPRWCLDKTGVLQQIKETFGRRRTFQGRLWQPELPA